MARWDNSDTRVRGRLSSNNCCIIYSRFAYSGRYEFTDWNSTKLFKSLAMAFRGVVFHILQYVVIGASAKEAAFISRRVYGV